MKNLLLLIVALAAFALPSPATVTNAQSLTAQGFTVSSAPAVVASPVIFRSIVTTSPLAPLTVVSGSLSSTAYAAAYAIDPSASTLESKWTTANGTTWRVIAPRRVGEFGDNQAKRLNIAVKAMQKELGGSAAIVKGT